MARSGRVETEAPGLPFARIRHYAHTMPMPDFPVDLGPNPIQTTDPSDYGRIVYNTQVGKQSVRNTPKPDPIVYPEGFGRYEDA